MKRKELAALRAHHKLTDKGMRRGGTVFIQCLSSLRMVSGQEKFYDYVNHDGKPKHWVGIGWIEPNTHPPLCTLPKVVGLPNEATWPIHGKAMAKTKGV